MDFELNSRYILCVCEQGNLTRAAKVIGISQPALSAAISNVEKKIGFKIFDKRSQPFALTKEGEIYLAYLRKQKLLVEDCKTRIEELYDDEKGKVVIGGPTVYTESLIADAAAALHTAYPGYEIAIKNASVPELIKMTKKGEVDCFIGTSDNLPEGFEISEIKEERIYLCIPQTWPVNEKLEKYRVELGMDGECFDYTILNNLGLIFLESNQPLQIEIDKFMEENNLCLQKVLSVDQVAVAVRMTALGMGISFASEEALANSKYLEDICLYRPSDAILKRKIYVVSDKERYMTCACKRFIDILHGMNDKGRGK